MHKEKKSRGHKIIVLLLLSVILLLAAIACALSLRLYKRSDPALAGHWQTELNLTDTAARRKTRRAGGRRGQHADTVGTRRSAPERGRELEPERGRSESR